MNSKINLQDNILNQVRKKNIPVVIYLMNGFQLNGTVLGFDNFTIILENEGQEKVIYKHAISTIEPQQSVKEYLSFNSKE